MTKPATVSSVEFPQLDPAAAETARKQVKERTAALRELAPDMGAYMNEVRQPLSSNPPFLHPLFLLQAHTNTP
jgi:hypothetical protein